LHILVILYKHIMPSLICKECLQQTKNN